VFSSPDQNSRRQSLRAGERQARLGTQAELAQADAGSRPDQWKAGTVLAGTMAYVLVGVALAGAG